MPVPHGVAVFAVPAVPPPGRFVLDGPEGRHAATVRRTRVGETLVLTDGAGAWASARVEAVGRGDLTLAVGDTGTQRPPALRVSVAQALPKGDRASLAVELATEAGADGILPWAAQRCVAQWSGDKQTAGRQRWQQVAVEAAKQSRRVWFPQVEALSTTTQLAQRVRASTTGGDAALILHEAGSVPIREARIPAAGELLLIVGPEGGVTDAEIQELAAAGAQPVRLGPEVLRTSTAAAVALGALGVLAHRW